MYVTKMIVQNVGPMEYLDIEMPFNPDGKPKPVVLVGENGTGKTILLAHVVDALYEFAADHFVDLLPQYGSRRQYFKLTGPANQRQASTNGFCFLNFQDNGHTFQYIDKTGKIALDECKVKTGGLLQDLGGWDDTANLKRSSNSAENFPKIFQKDIFCYFPSYRAEYPHWLNHGAEGLKDQFSLRMKIADRLEKPIMVQTSAEENKKWLLDLVLDHELYADTILWESANKILRAILVKPNARFGIGPRIGINRVSVVEETPQGQKQVVPSIDNLSAGQSTLLNIFFTILRYGDRGNTTNLQELEGIVLIDEIDAHLHTALQKETLPNLIKMYPKIQFFITSHSPVFLLGMESTFGADGFTVMEMPMGKQISAQDFSEYSMVVNALQVASSVSKTDNNIVLLVEGETDKVIIENTWSKLNSNIEMPFAVVNAFDCFFIQNAMLREDIFMNNPSKTFIGMLDFDEAFGCFERVSEKKTSWCIDKTRKEKDGLVLQHLNQRGFLFLLPVPDFRIDLASEAFGKNSALSIELLFEDRVVGPLQEKKLPGGGKKQIFPDDKKGSFADKTAEFATSDFEAFKPVFKLILDIIQQTELKDRTI